MTSLGFPGLSSQSISGFSGGKGPKNVETDWAREAQACHPSLFRGVLAEKGQKTLKRTGMTTLGSPGLSSPSVSGFSGRKGPKNPETEWDDNPGKPKLVIPVGFGVFWPKSAKKTRNGDYNPGKPRLVIPVRFGVFWPNRAKKTRNGLG